MVALPTPARQIINQAVPILLELDKFMNRIIAVFLTYLAMGDGPEFALQRGLLDGIRLQSEDGLLCTLHLKISDNDRSS